MSEPGAERRLAAIVAIDVAGYSRLMGADEVGTLATLKSHRAVTDPISEKHGGRIVGTAGDGLLLEFPSVVAAVSFAVETQGVMAERNADIVDDQKMLYRIGINLGDVLVDGDDIYGDGVNVAARLEGLAEPGGICISGSVHEQVRDKIDIAFDDRGDVEVKNITRPVHVWRWVAEGQAAASPAGADGPLPLPDKPSIAVLPFDNMSGDPEQEYFADGITEDIITTLSKVPRLFVIARNSTFLYKGRAVDIKQVAVDLGVRYVLEGSVRKAGTRVRINAQLIEASSGLHEWADQYDGSLDDVFALQDEITQEIVAAMEVQLTEGEQARVWRERAGNARVYEHFLRGRAHYQQFTRRSNARGREEWEAAIRLNPTFPMAYVNLSYTYADEMRWGWGKTPDQALHTASELIDKALELDPDLSEAICARGYVRLQRREHEAAVADAERAVVLGPSSGDTNHVAAMIFNYSGLPEEGVSVAKHGIRLSPIAYSNAFTELGHSHCLLHQYDQAIDPLMKVLAETPFWQTARAMLVFALTELGRVDQASAQVEELLRGNPRFSLGKWANSHPYRYQEHLERYLDGLRKAGIPE